MWPFWIFVAAVPVNWFLAQKFFSHLKRHGLNVSEGNSFRLLIFVVTRRYASIPNTEIRVWGDIFLTWTVLIWGFVIGLMIYYPPNAWTF
jgi:hypothetical protein